MNKLTIALLIVTMCFAHFLPTITEMTGDKAQKDPRPLSGRGTLIATCGDIRAIMGPQGKNIAVCQHGDVMAVIYGDPTTDPNNIMEIKIAYSLDSGATWTVYGPFSSEQSRMYPGVDGSTDFCTNPDELYFVWQEYDGIHVMSWAGVGVTVHPFGFLTSIAVNPENPHIVIISSCPYLPYGDRSIFCWMTYDGGYTWTDTTRMLDSISNQGCAGHMRWGEGNYIFYTYLDLYNFGSTDIAYPYYIESTDGGYTWSGPTPLPEVPVINLENAQFWWTELDCEVINNEPWTVHNDINQTFPDSAGMWLFHGTGNPGNRIWEILNIRELGAESLRVGDTLYYCYPSQFPNVSYEPVSNTILVSYKAFYLMVCGSDTVYNGAHIGGVYSTDNGATWTVSGPLSDPNTGEVPWYDWSATEVAHCLANVNGNVYSSGIWINGLTLDLFFERGMLGLFVQTGIKEYGNNNFVNMHLQISPSIATDIVRLSFSMVSSGNVTIKLYDVTGRRIETLFNGYLNIGDHVMTVDTSGYTNGTYFTILEKGGYSNVVKLVVHRR